ncbi:Fic family protein [Streptomyces kaniharaensis]|uniref:Fic family protein n=1 Tax=Streptomyces kaniharaensis TaxID=212423 RepID=A0A6N7L346_9ACTN|nr:Fic family protein [Streptomyces kaniharaensis]MQS16554.1 Fic family protein [Streptomyces kaniharaensis]
MILELYPGGLAWDDVDPARHPFDPESAAREIRALGPARHVTHRPDPSCTDATITDWGWTVAERWTDAMTLALVERFGGWAAGWRYSTGEGGLDGGPVGHWCCPRDSVTTPKETIDRVAASLCEWREWLESLADRFEAYPLDPAALDDQRILWERAVRNLVQQVVDRTGAESGWYGHCHEVLTWFLNRWGFEPEPARQAIGGRFKSWTAPKLVLIDDVAERIALSLPLEGSVAQPAEPAPDHLRSWLALRGTVAWPEPSPQAGDGPVTAERDGAAEDIRHFDAALDPARAAGLLTALDLLRADAARGARLDFDLLRGWQQHILGTPEPPPFRTLPAFAKEGRERYGIAPDTRAHLDKCLAESAADGELPLIARAARAYLDVCFFHPFDDGNARAAFLTLVFVLAREGVTLEGVGLLRRVSFQADNPDDPPTLARYIHIHLNDSRRGVG